MKKGTAIKLILSMLVVLSSIYIVLKKPIRLGLDLRGGVYAVLEAQGTEENPVTNESMNRLVTVLNRRINSIGVAESVIQRAGSDRVIIEMPGVKNPDEAINLIGKTALLEFRIMKDNGELGPTLLTGTELSRASVGTGEFGRPQINFEMTTQGASRFAEITRNNKGRVLAITLDGEIQTAAKINDEIPGGRGVITGNFTRESAMQTASLLDAGALPLRANIIEIRTVGATLGDESIRQSARAGILALILIALFMLILYRFLGIIAIFALVSFGAITFGTLNFIEATLTLPGIAGVILSLGMAVDANVIIFERIKEEIRMGNSVQGAIKQGFAKGFSSILDGQVTTLIIATILFIFGTGPVKGFAVTLTIGTIASMFTALTLTKALLISAVEVFKIEEPKIFIGTKEKKELQWDIVGKSKMYIAIASIGLFLSIGVLFTKGLNYGIDFTGGNLFQIRYERTLNLNEINAFLDKKAEELPQLNSNSRRVQLSEDGVVIIRTSEMNEVDKERLLVYLKELGDFNVDKLEKVGASIGSELKEGALFSLIGGLLLIGLYITIRYEKRFAISGMVTLLHDVIVALGAIAFLGYELNTEFIAAILTILGYSINDTVIIFDRIREKLKKDKKGLNFKEILNISLNDVMVRSLNTSITTLLAAFAILFYGGDSLRTFIVTLIVGILAGTYSSIFIATPLIYLMDKDRDGSGTVEFKDEDEGYKEKIVV